MQSASRIRVADQCVWKCTLSRSPSTTTFIGISKMKDLLQGDQLDLLNKVLCTDIIFVLL